MEELQANITAVCPSAFSGASGQLFAAAIATVVTAHCAIFDDYKWPKDSADEIIQGASGDIFFDFIVVGAGTAGSLLASRLASHYPSWSVLLVEAGGDPGLESEIPALLFLNQKTDIDWNYETEPDEKSCLGFINNTCLWSKGKGLGGSNSINAMLYIRGHPEDFNEWRELGNQVWGYDDLSKYFDVLEKEFNFSNYKYHENPLYGILQEAWKELGFKPHENDNNEAIVGIKVTKLLVNNGKRINTAKMYLNGLKNMRLMKNTVVQRIIIDPETKIATGIQIKHLSGIVMKISFTKEVILSAGSIATPHILMLSGIGPKEMLNNNEIKCLADLPVGQNLQDHVMLPLFLKTNLHTTISNENITSFLLQYMLTRTGPFSNIGITDFMAFTDTQNNERPDLQFHHTYFTKKNNFMMKPYLRNIGYKDDIIEAIEKLNEASDLLGIYPTLLHPKSKGELVLTSNNPQSRPIIKTNYFQDPDDIESLLQAIQFINKLENTETFKSLGIELTQLNIKDCQHLADKEYWECYVRHMATTIYHPVGTAKMGPINDKTSVVNKDLLVHGIQKLRVVDASIMPSIPGGNTMAPTLVIAEKATGIIKMQYGVKDEL